jgi:hypothetical protein
MIIYKTTNLINDKIYVGQSCNNNSNYYGSGKYILNALKKYGKENFKKEILIVCKNKHELNWSERYCIVWQGSRDYNGGYNLTDGGNGVSGFKAWNKGKKGLTTSWNKGLNKEIDSRIYKAAKKCKISHTGLKQNKETCEKRSKSMIGKNIGKIHSIKQNKECADKHRKTYICIDPNNNKFETNNLKQFCENNNISYRCMLEYHKTKGWICKLK